MSNNLPAFERFQGLLREMFQFDHNELDFGLFRVMRLKRTFIEQFVSGEGDQDLKQIVSRELAAIRGADDADERQWIANRCELLGIRGKAAWENLLGAVADPEKQENLRSTIRLLELPDQVEATLDRMERWLQGQSVSSTHLEAQLYNYLLNFFDLYYQNGDFGYNSRSSAAFQVPYEAAYDGADTMFHFKHRDCYYIKTGNSFPEVALDVMGKRLVFRLEAGGDDEAGAQNNNKDSAVKLYALSGISEEDGSVVVRFRLAKEGTAKAEIYPRIIEALSPGAAVSPFLMKKSKDGEAPIFKDLGKDHDKAEGGQLKGINQLRLSEDGYLSELAKVDHFKGLGSNAEARATALKGDAMVQALLAIDRALNRFYVGQDADYFIHKDLKGFLTREKDRFIKSVIFSDLDALLSLKGDASTRVLARAFDAVATRIIEFLDATETFQRNLFTLKKKVIDTHWLISLGKIPEQFWEGLLANPRLVAWWQSELKQKVVSLDDMKARPTLVVDTSLFQTAGERALIDQILADPAFDHLDDKTDGLLIHSENWQALNLLSEKFRERIQCIYIDPPYNTGGDGFLYKDSFRHSSWAAMMADRLALAKGFLGERGVIFSSIDDKERDGLVQLMAETFGPSNRVEELIWAQNSTKNQSPTYSNNHEYVEVFARRLENVKADPAMFREIKPGYTELVELLDSLNPKYPSIDEIETAISELFERHREELQAELEESGLEYDRANDLWKGTFPYKNAEYRDATGKLVSPVQASERAAKIWIWKSADSSMPKGGGTDKKVGVHTQGDPDYRFYRPLHPTTKKPSPHPKSGWRFPEKPMGLSTSFEEMDADNRIIWGPTERSVPQIKRFLHEVETAVGKSVVSDFTDGEKQLTAVFGKQRSFPNPKPTTLIGRFIEQTTQPSEWVMDFFVGSGTTGHAILEMEERRRFVLTEMGDYFDRITKPRLARLMFSRAWKAGEPGAAHPRRHIIKVQRLEQYEDVIANLSVAWDEGAMPEGIPVRYLFRPDESRVRLTLNLAKPFDNRIKAGREGKEVALDLMETRALLQGYWVRSLRMFDEGGKTYRALETECGCLILFRDIADGEDDSGTVNRIAAAYQNEDSTPRLSRLELNHWADLRRIDLPAQLLAAGDFDRGAQWS